MTKPILEPFVRQWAVLLVTYKRDGTPVGTPVSIAVEGERAFVRTWDTAWKFRRIRNNPEVEVAPSTARGKPTGPAIRARARVLEGEESAYAGRLLARKHPVLHGILVPLAHRLMGYRTVHIELTPVSGHNPGAGESALRPISSSARSSGSRRPGG
jgi:PPOX class probable F420-dependent enzyme